MKTIGLISDTHIPSRGNVIPKQVFKAFKEVDLILHAGDFEGVELIPILEEIAPLIAVHGNMCHKEIKDHFPSKQLIEVEKVKIGIVHGSGGPSGYYSRLLDEFKVEEMPNIIISGHTHQPVAKIVNNVHIINPGSPTDKYFAPRNTVAILEIDGARYSYKYIEL